MSENILSFAHTEPSIFHSLGEDDHSDEQGMNILWKILSLLLILALTLIFGLMPSYW
jgi:hypothetical protein